MKAGRPKGPPQLCVCARLFVWRGRAGLDLARKQVDLLSMNPVSGPLPIDPNVAVSLQGSQEALSAMLPGSAGAPPSFGPPAYLNLSASAQSLLATTPTPTLDPTQQVAMAGLAATSAELGAFFPGASAAPLTAAPSPYPAPVSVAPGAPGDPSLVAAYDPTLDPANPAYVGPAPSASAPSPAPPASAPASPAPPTPPYSYDPTQDPANPAYTGSGAPTPAPIAWSQDTANPSYWA